MFSLLEFLRTQAPGCRYVTAVCTGSLVLAAAGLHRDYRATTHWMSLERLARFGAIPTKGRVVTDRNRITGGGVTARSEEHTSELQSLMRISYAVFCLKKKK